MNAYESGLEALAKSTQRKITGRCALMHKRIKDVTEMYAEEEQAVIREVKDTAATFGVQESNAEGMARVLQLVLGSRGIDTTEPAPLFTEGETTDANGRLAQEGSGTPGVDQEERGGPRTAACEQAGSEPGRSGEDGATALAGGKRSGRKARSTGS